MAVIGKIREKSTFLLVMIGGALLLFILGDILNSGGSIFNRSRTAIGEVNGEIIEYKNFDNKVQTAIDNYKTNQKTKNVDQNTTDQIRKQTWDRIVKDLIMDRAFEELGLAVTSDELFDLVQGSNPHPLVLQTFTDPKTGAFNSGAVMEYLKAMDEDESGANKARWLSFENEIIADQKTIKYNNLIKKGLYVPTALAKDDYISKNKSIQIQFVFKKFAEMPDSTITVSESDIKNYYNDNKKKYKSEASRKIEFVTFEVMPSEDDMFQAQEWINKVATEFQTVTDDSMFVNINSDVRYQNEWLNKNSLHPSLDSALFNANIGTVVGPVLDGNLYLVGKLLQTSMFPDSVKARHILLKPDGATSREALEARADSIKNLIKGGQNFADLASKLSQDEGSAIKGGDLGWFLEGMMVKPFNDACFQGKKGDMPVVASEFGVHLIEILDRGKESKRIKVAIIRRAVEPSTKTLQMTYSKADGFAKASTNKEAFEKEVTEKSLNKRLAEGLKETDNTIAGLESPRELIRWSYTVKEGTVSSVFELGNKFVVAILVEALEKGFAPIASLKEEIEIEVRKDKKAEILTKEFDSKLTGTTTIAELAQKMGVQVDTSERAVFASGSLASVGNEPAAVGTAFGLKAGQISKPVKGNSGVFVVSAGTATEPAATEDFTPMKRQIANNYRVRVDNESFEVLKESAGVVDNRGKFY